MTWQQDLWTKKFWLAALEEDWEFLLWVNLLLIGGLALFCMWGRQELNTEKKDGEVHIRKSDT